MLKTIIVDDEPLAGDILENYIQRIPTLQLVKRCYSAIEALDVINNQEVDVILLDIEMPQLSGIDFVKSLKQNVQVIFTTAYPEFALQGYDLNAVDYLLKPISFERFIKAIHKLDSKHKTSPVEIDSSKQDYMFVKADKKLVKLKFQDILYIEGLKDYVIIRTDTTRVITLQTMKSLEEKLNEEIFLRIHRSFIVNFNKINAIIGNDVEVIEKGQSKLLPIGKNYKDQIDEIISKKKL